jgi:hypothetical protein
MNYLIIVLRSVFLLHAMAVTPALSQEKNSEVIIVANLTEAIKTIEKNDLRNIFLGRGDYGFIPAVPSPEAQSRVIFNTQIIGLNESRIQSFYAQMRFSGLARPPIQIYKIDELIEFLSVTPMAISYLPKDTKIPDNLTIVFNISMQDHSW